MTQFQVDSELVHTANTAIQNTISQLHNEVGALQAQLTSLQDSWRGVAANEFQSLVARWNTTAITVREQLGQIGSALAMAATQYEEIEAANMRLFL
jgi:WXG100 family type VII secretion target